MYPVANGTSRRQGGECSEYERKFAVSYAKTFTKKWAAIEAGAPTKNADKEGARLFALPRVRRIIDQIQELHAVVAKVAVENVLKELYGIATADPMGCFNKDGSIKPLGEIEPNLRRVIQSIETETVMRRDPDNPAKFMPVQVTKIKFWSKTETLRDLGRYLKMFTDNVNLSGKISTVKELLLSEDEPSIESITPEAPASEGTPS